MYNHPTPIFFLPSPPQPHPIMDARLVASAQPLSEGCKSLRMLGGRGGGEITSYHVACTNQHSPVAASLGRQRGLDQQEKAVAHPHGDRAVYKELHPPMCRRFSYIDRLRVAL